MLLRSALATVGGLLLAGSSEPLGLAALIPLGVAAFFVAVHDQPPRRALLTGLVFGVSFCFVLTFWMRAVGWDAWLALAGVLTVFFPVLGWALARLSRLRAWPLWYAVAWVAVETIRGGWPLSGMPWGRLSYAVAGTPWASALPWLGFTGVSLLLALTGGLLAWLVVDRPGWRVAVPVAAALMVVTAVPALIDWDPRIEGRVTVAVVQGDVPGDGDDVAAVHRQVTANHVTATVGYAAAVAAGREEAADFVLWPENSTAVDPFDDPEVNAGIVRATDAVGVPVLVGALVDAPDPRSSLNQGIVWEPGLGGTDRYTKRHPVPFGEYIPWRDTLVTGNFGKLALIPRDQVSGTRLEPLRIAGTLVADAICFDVAYDDGIHGQLRNGGELLAVQTSNAMFIRTHQIAQQFEITRLRALETGRFVMVAATNGVSGVIAPDGTVRAVAEPRTTEVLVEEVGLSTRVTPAVRMGEWPGRALVVAAAVLLGLTLLSRRRGGEPMSYARQALATPPSGARL